MLPNATEHNYISNTALPYVTLDSVTSTDPRFADGANLMTSVQGYSETRPGFAAVAVPAPLGGWAGTIKRMFCWRRWDAASSGATRGNFFCMVSTTDASNAYVYKYNFSSDTNAVLLLTQTGSTEPFDFFFSNNTCLMGNGASTGASLGRVDCMKAYNGTTLRNWGITAPASAPTLSTSGTGIDCLASYYYVYTYCNSGTGHESSPSPVSLCLTPFTNKTISIAVTASSDTQVDQIRLYRTTDGGSFDPAVMREVPGSPFANATATIADTAADTSLSAIKTAPPSLRNDPPPPAYGFVGFAGRIAMIDGTNPNKIWFTGNEECRWGVYEESVPSGTDGNFEAFDSQVQGLAEVSDGVVINTTENRYKIEGFTLDTFWRYKLSAHQGTRQRAAVSSFGQISTWLDTSSAIWLEGGVELSQLIRPTLEGIASAQAAIAIHMQGKYRWIVLLDGGNSRLLVYDTETEQWMPPWTFSKSVTSIHSGETALGTFDLLLAYDNVIVKMTPGAYNDNGDLFAPSAKTNLFNISPSAPIWWKFNEDTYSNPLWRGELTAINLETNGITPASVKVIVDESTASTATGDAWTIGWVDVKANEVPPDKRRSGALLDEKRYPCSPQTYSGRRMGLWMTWPARDQQMIWYSLDVEHKLTFLAGGK